MKVLMELENLLEEEIWKIVRKGDVTPTELERLDKAVDIIKDSETICAMREYGYKEEEEEYGYSERYPQYMRDGGRTSYSYAPMGNNSYRRGRDAMTGRYISRDMDPRYYGDGRGQGYSGHASKEDMKQDLKEMMNNASSDKERMAIQQLLDQWKD